MIETGLDSLASAVKAQLTLGNLRFFTPTDRFWEVLHDIVPADVALVDCGTGRGDLIEEAASHNIPMIGIDISKREGQSSRVLQADALTWEWGNKTWPMFCRPSHDGWSFGTMRKARKANAHVIYVGLSGNYENDMGATRSRNLGIVGEEGERLYFLKPYKAMPKFSAKG